MVCAQTGSGKTLVFLLPILQRLSEGNGAAAQRPARLQEAMQPVPFCPEAVVIAPTAELAMQLSSLAEQLASFLPNPPSVKYLAELQHEKNVTQLDGMRLAISTPDVLLQCVRDGLVSLEQVEMLAIDEADAILCTQEFIAEQGNEILSKCEANQQSLQLVFTMAHLSEVNELELIRRFPAAQRVFTTGVLVPTLRQCFHYFRGDKDGKLLAILESADEDPWLRDGATIIFCSGAGEAERICTFLKDSLPLSTPMALHSETRADQRAAVLHAFRSGEARVLVANDAAARGLDFPSLRHVIMYDVPLDLTAFVHCAGRTARRGQSGLVTCLVQTHEAAMYEQFDLKSHHALLPAPQLTFPSEEDVLGRMAPHEKTKKKKKQPSERRVDLVDGRQYSFQELQRYYRRDYTESEIYAYWNDKCRR